MAAKLNGLERARDEEWPPWSDYIRNAWAALRDDRFVGAMGGMGRIYWTAIDRYADMLGLTGQAYDDFETFIRALDDEFLRHVAEKQKAKKAES